MESSSTDDVIDLILAGGHPSPPAVKPGVLRNLSRDISFQVFGSLVASGLMLATHLCVARILGREAFGSLGAIQVFSQWCAILFSFGGTLTVTILAGQKRHTDKSGLFGVMGFYLLIVLILTSGAVVIEQHLNLIGLGNRLDIATGIAVAGYAVVLIAMEFCLGILRGSDRYVAANVFSIGQALSLAFGTIGGAIILANTAGTLWMVTVAGGILICSTVAIFSRRWGLSLRQLGEARAIGLGPGMRSYAAQVLEVASETFGVFYLARMSDMAGVGALIACQRICTIISKPASMMSVVVMGKVAGQRIGSSEALTTLRIARFTFLLGLASCIPMLVFINEFTALSLGPEFRDASLIMALHLVGAVFRAHASATVGFVVAVGCSAHYLRLKVAVLAATIVATVGLFPLVGSTSAAISYAVTSAMLAIGIREIVVSQVNLEWSAEVAPVETLSAAA